MPDYYPQMVDRGEPIKKGGVRVSEAIPVKYNPDKLEKGKVYDKKYPVTLLSYPRELGKTKHPTQKPVPLLEYLIRTYTLEGETVLDNCMGSGSTGVACLNTGRNFIGIEKDCKYFELAKERITSHEKNQNGQN